MHNKRAIIKRNYEKIGIIQTHIINNFKNYVIVTIIFLVRCSAWSIICQ